MHSALTRMTGTAAKDVPDSPVSRRQARCYPATGENGAVRRMERGNWPMSSGDSVRYGRIPARLGHAMLLLCSILAGLMVLELGVRLWYGPLPAALLDWSNSIVDARRAEHIDSSVIPDSALGWIGKPNFARPTHSNDADGFRTMPPVGSAPSVLALGDSFAYGSEAGDRETWPFYLQEMLGRPVVNAGVPGYGLDQTVLRAERLAERLKPGLLVVSFIADDVARTELSRAWGRSKPYFELRGDALELRNVPVPPNPAPASYLPAWEYWIGWSALATVVRNRLIADQHEYFRDHIRALPRGSGEQLACALMKRLAGIGTPTLVVAQYDPTGWEHKEHGPETLRISRHVLKCADEAGLATLDLFRPLDESVARHGLEELYGHHVEHHNSAGNRFTSEHIVAELKRRRML